MRRVIGVLLMSIGAVAAFMAVQGWIMVVHSPIGLYYPLLMAILALASCIAGYSLWNRGTNRP